ncbi:hypothetical protein Tco_1165168 [Tanacetum coccineum]
MLVTRGSRKVTKVEAQINNKTKSIRCLEHTLLGQTTRRNTLDLYLCATSENSTIMDRALKCAGIGRRNMLETYLYVTSASFTTLACVRQGVTIESGGVTKQEIVGSQAQRQNQGPQWQN